MSASLLFNPAQASREELESTFVGRHALLERIENDLIRDDEVGTPRHWLVIGPRGSGKTHLTELLARRMRANQNWRIARLPEENYQIASLGELLEQIFLRSEDFIGQSPLVDTSDDVQLQDRAVDRLRQLQDASKKPLLVILENMTSLFDHQLKSVRDQARLRDILTNNPPFVLVATSTNQPEATIKHSAPLYAFFQTIFLDDLSQADITQLVKAQASWERNASLLADFERVKSRIEAIYHLSGGNPRLTLALYRVVQHGVATELYDQIMKLLDEVTPDYQARLHDLPLQAARVLTEMAVSDTIIAPAEIARRCRMPTNQVTAQVRRLLEARLVVHGGKPDGRSQLYEIKDRLLRIWLQMRESVGTTRHLRFLAEFFEHWYADGADELEAFRKRTVIDLWTKLAVGDDRHCVDLLKALSDLADVHPGFDSGSAHRPHCEGAALELISALADKTARPLSQYAINLLVEILPALRHSRSAGAAATRQYLQALSLVRERTTPASLGKAFRSRAPFVAKNFKGVAKDLLDLYREWLAEGLLSEPIPPYSDAVSALSSDDPEKILQLLHPESRDAVRMLLDAIQSDATWRAPSGTAEDGVVRSRIDEASGPYIGD